MLQVVTLIGAWVGVFLLGVLVHRAFQRPKPPKPRLYEPPEDGAA